MSRSGSPQGAMPARSGEASGRAPARSRRSGRFRVLLPASMVVSFLAASSVPTPLYSTYAREWHFSPITTTVVFSAYGIAVLVALLVVGRVSDHVGRRPVLLSALGVQLVATVLLLCAGGVDALVVARVLQGIATGGALGALGAAMVDVDRARGPLANAAAPGVGTASGALLGGLLVQYVPAPTHVVYVVLIVVFVLQGIGVLMSPESGTRKPGLAASLIPQVALPPGTRAPLLAAAPILFAVWALSGFYGSLGPALARQLSGSASAVVGGLPYFVLGIVSSFTAIVLRRTSPHVVMLSGIVATLVAAAGTLLAVGEASAAAFFASTVVAGFGFGAGLQGAFRTVLPLAPLKQRAGVVSVLYVVCYFGLGVPAVVAGILVVHGGGLVASARDYAVFLIVLALAALVGLLVTARSGRFREAAAGGA